MAAVVRPIFFGLHDFVSVGAPREVARDETLQRRHEYMNAWAFAGRAIFFFALWNLHGEVFAQMVSRPGPDFRPAPRATADLERAWHRPLPIDRDLCLCGLDYVHRTSGGTAMFAVIVLIGQS